LLFLSACKTAEKQEKENKSEEVVREEIVKEAEEEPESWVNHYYNRGIYEKDGYTYRQFPGGIFRRKAGFSEWEQLCEIPISVGRGLTAYGDRLYFTCYQEEADEEGSGWNNSVFYLDLNTGEAGELLTAGPLASTVVVYDGCLYVEHLEEGYMLYDGWRLDENGEIREKLDNESENFICYEQNLYNLAEYEMMRTYGQNEGAGNHPGEIVRKAKHGVISIPYCAAMLGGKAVLQQQNDESTSHFYLRDLNTGEDTFLFDAADVLFVLQDGIYYVTDSSMLMYYSFAEVSFH